MFSSVKYCAFILQIICTFCAPKYVQHDGIILLNVILVKILGIFLVKEEMLPWVWMCALMALHFCSLWDCLKCFWSFFTWPCYKNNCLIVINITTCERFSQINHTWLIFEIFIEAYHTFSAFKWAVVDQGGSSGCRNNHIIKLCTAWWNFKTKTNWIFAKDITLA